MRLNKFLLLIFISTLTISTNGVCEETQEIEINSEVVTIDPKLDFFIIEAGEDSGVEIGDGLIVHRNWEKIAAAYIIEVMPNVSAAEILNMEKGKEIIEGDKILIVKKIKPRQNIKPDKKTKEIKTTQKSKWVTLGGTIQTTTAPAKKEKAVWANLLGEKQTTDVDTSMIEITYGSPANYDEASLAVEPIVISINKDVKTVLSYTRLILRETGFSTTLSDTYTGILIAAKAMELSLLKELWADATAAIDHNVVISIGLKENDNKTTLKLSSFIEHSQKSIYVKRSLTKDSKYYKEILALVSEIKKRSEL